MSDGLTEAMRGMKLGPEEPKPTPNQKCGKKRKRRNRSHVKSKMTQVY